MQHHSLEHQGETAFDNYVVFRRSLDNYDPRLRNGMYCDPQDDTGFKMLLINHKSDVNKLKRIEAVPRSVEVVWTDAS